MTSRAPWRPAVTKKGPFVKHLSLLAFALCAPLAALAPASAEAPYSFEAAPGKLPKTVVPISYDIALRPNLTAKTFEGNETVLVTVSSATASIVFNTHDMVVSQAQLSGAPAPAIATDNVKQITTLSFARPVQPGRHSLVLSFSGKIGAAPQGLFYQDFTTPAGKKTMLATQMESADARRMFPGWDEPSFRAIYRLKVTIPKNFDAVSNMPQTSEAISGDLKTVAFAPTPKMASYLVVLCAGEFGYLNGSADGVKIRVVAPKGQEQNGQYALDAAEKLLSYYDDYFGSKFPLPKLDLIDVPGGFPGAMENWGGITFNERVLMFDSKTEADSAKEEIFQDVAHEMAHQWFGDLVTLAWWDNLWLNEGFADWMQTKATDHFNPEWHLWDRVNGDVEEAMSTDGQTTTHPVQTPIADETQADAAFDEITYQKGGAFIRMMEAYLGETAFRDGIRLYMKQNAYSNTTSANLYAALGATSHQDVAAFAKAWTLDPGFPLVTVTETCSGGTQTLAVSQQRFFYEPNQTSTQLWQIPLTIAPASHPADAHVSLLTAASATVPGGSCGEPVLVNAGATGYFRVMYDAATAKMLSDRIEQLAPADRVRIVADSAATMFAGTIAPSAYLDLAARLGDDQNLAVLTAEINTNRLLSNIEEARPGENAFDAYQRAQFRPAFERIGWDPKPGEGPTVEQVRGQLINALGNAGDTKVIAEARARFAKFLTDPNSLAVGLRGPVLNVVGLYADEATWKQLAGLAQTAPTREEKQMYGVALWHARDPKLAAVNLELSLKLPPEVGPIPGLIDIVTVATAARQPKLAWDFFAANEPKLTEQLSSFEKALMVSRFLPAFWNAAPLDTLEGFAKSHMPPEAAPQLARSVHAVELINAESQRILPPLDAWVSSHASTTAATN